MSGVFNVACMLCGRVSGQVRSGTFVLASDAPLPIRDQGKNRCGFCQGNLYLEADDAGVLPHTDSELKRRAS
jgi:hypothetical protein